MRAHARASSRGREDQIGTPGFEHEGGPKAAIDILAGLLRYFEGFGPVGLLAFLFTVLCLDAMLVPTLPEFFVMAFYAANPSLAWGATLLAVVVAAELTGNALMYGAVKRVGLPTFLRRKMEQWTSFLIVKDERIILVNRVAPILPFAGAFVAVMKWDARRAFLYIFVGASVKYAVLIAFVGFFFLYYPPTTARNITLILIVTLVVVSLIQGEMAKRRHLGPVASRVAHIGEHSTAPGAPAGDGEGHRSSSTQKGQQQ